MYQCERKILEIIEKNMEIIFLVVISIIAYLIRCAGKDFISGDMEMCLIPWFDKMVSNGGISALKEQVGDYNILYQTVIAMFTYMILNYKYQLHFSRENITRIHK